MELIPIENVLRLDKHLYFGVDSSGVTLGQGWSEPEPDFCWTDGVVAKLRFMLPPTTVPLYVAIDCKPKMREASSTHVLFSVNGWITYESHMRDRAKVRLPIEANTSVVNLAIIVPGAITPASLLAEPPDYRMLGVCVYAIGLEER